MSPITKDAITFASFCLIALRYCAKTKTKQAPSATDTPEVDVVTGELAQEITLDPTAKDFDERKAELKGLGYTWNSEKKAWSLQ